MVLYIREKGGYLATWYDGLIPTKAQLKRALRPNSLHARGLHDRVVDDLLHKGGADSQNKNREELFMDLLDVHMLDRTVCVDRKKTGYQSALFKPKWNRTNKPRHVRLAEKWMYGYDRFFPEDDRLLEHISPRELLHVRPAIKHISDEVFYQLICIYPSAGIENWGPRNMVTFEMPPRPGFLHKIKREFNLKSADVSDYHNYPVFEYQLRNLLREMVEVHERRDNISDKLSNSGFRVTTSRKRLIPLPRKP